MDVIAYIRVSTSKQEASGLGVEAQRDYIIRAADQNGWNVVAEYIDTTSGAIAPRDRPECAKAFSHGMPVVVAKLDRLSRSVAHIATLMENTQFKVATMPQAETFQLHLFAALAEQEKVFIRNRTKDALAALSARAAAGDSESIAKVSRRSQGLEAGRSPEAASKARQHHIAKAHKGNEAVRPHVEACLYNKCRTFQSIADCLNMKRVTTARGGKWNATQVRRVMLALSLSLVK